VSLLYGTTDNRGGLLPVNGVKPSAGQPYDETAWTDAASSALEGTGAAGLVQQDFPENASPFQALCMVHNANDQLSFATQMPHSWNKGQVRPHVHVVPLANPAVAQVARFTMQYAWSRVGFAVPALAAWPTLVGTITVNPGEALVQKVVNFGLIDPAVGAEESNVLLWVVTRTGLDAGDTYDTNKTWQTGAANLSVLSFDVHYQVEKSGSFPEFIP